jgi:hypothetical protein
MMALSALAWRHPRRRRLYASHYLGVSTSGAMVLVATFIFVVALPVRTWEGRGGGRVALKGAGTGRDLQSDRVALETAMPPRKS